MYQKVVSVGTGIVRGYDLHELPEMGLFLLIHSIILTRHALEQDLLLEDDESMKEVWSGMLKLAQHDYDEVLEVLHASGVLRDKGDLKRWFYWWDDNLSPDEGTREALETMISHGEDVSMYVPQGNWREP